jgi:ABC-2 type transport system ATP-binding protein
MIEISGLTRYFGPAKALDRIDLRVRQGEVMGFLGPNGAGKTTAMRILAGLLAPTEGLVKVAGIDVIDQPVQARAQIGFLPETPPIYGEMTVTEYLRYLAALRRVPRAKRTAAVNAALEKCGLTTVAQRLLRNLSKGYRQRAGIAQAIVHNPKVVILDEPTVGLDPIQIREIRRLIRNLGGEHSVLLSTHILPEVQMTCDRVAVISQGRIMAEDTLAGLENRAKQKKGWRVRWTHPVTAAEIQALPGVAQCEPDGRCWLIAATEGAPDPIPTLVAASVENGWNLRELTPETHSLEEIFVQLTTQEHEPANSAHTEQEAA